MVDDPGSPPLRDRVAAAIGAQYELEDEIGRGGMSVVFRARDTRLNRLVAIKVLPPELAHDAAVRTRFTREAQTSALLTHPHIVPIHDVGEREGIAFLVMAYVAGGNLAALLTRQPRQPVEEVRRLVAEIADALTYAHVRGVIHRDIKPDNILLDGDTGRAMVTDFGIARAMEAGTRLTITGVAVGTPTYMSPEQAVGERELDGRSDIYSLGVLAYQLLTGRVPFTAGNSMALMMKHVTEKPRPIADLRPDAPRPLRFVIERALAKAPEDRWPTAAALRDALISGDVPTPLPEPEPEPPRRILAPLPAARDERAERAERAGPPARRPSQGIQMVPDHLAPLTEDQRADLRLWHGRVDLMDRIKTARWYTLGTITSVFAAMGGMAGAANDVPPAALLVFVPFYMGAKLWRRFRSLRRAGLRIRRVLFMPLSRWVIPPAPPTPPTTGQQLEKLAPRDVLDGPLGPTIRRAVEDRAAIVNIAATLSKADRAMLPELAPTADALIERISHVAHHLYRLDQGIDRRLIADLDARISTAERDRNTPDGERRLALLKRQRGTFEELAERRAALARQLESAGLALGNLRLDLIKLRSSGLQSALSDVSTATQEARALSREIGIVLDAAAEVKGL